MGGAPRKFALTPPKRSFEKSRQTASLPYPSKEQPLMKNARNRRHILLFVCPLIFLIVAITAAAFQKKSPATPGDPLIAGFKKSYPASVCDAVNVVPGKNGTMLLDMKLISGTPIEGRAVTSLVKPASPENATPALSTKHSVEMIDNANPGEVGVIVMEGTLDIAA